MMVELPPTTPEGLVVGRRLRGCRLARHVELGWLAERSGVERSRIALAEQGRAELSSADLHRITGALHLPLDFLFTERGDLSRLRPFA